MCAREALLEAITIDRPEAADAVRAQARAVTRAVALSATLAAVAPAFSSAELELLFDWLDRIARQDAYSAPGQANGDG